MRSSLLSSLLFAVLTTASVAVSANPASQAPAMPPAASTSAMQGMQAEQSGMVNLNTATAETLQKELSGIGSAKAMAIVAYRDANGEFASVDELLEVKGIGKAILDKNRDKVTVK